MTQLDYRPWAEDDDPSCFMGLKTTHQFTCLFCNADMQVHDVKLMEFSLRGDERKDSHAIDVVLWCSRCGYIDIYGVAVSEEHWARAKSKILELMEKNEYVYLISKETIKEAVEKASALRENTTLEKNE